MSADGYLIVLVTAPPGAAAGLAEALVSERLAACVNVVPGLLSIYCWQGERQRDEESLLLIKTSRALLERLSERVRQLHPYDVPEVVALPIVGGSADYLRWVAGELAEGDAPDAD